MDTKVQAIPVSGHKWTDYTRKRTQRDRLYPEVDTKGQAIPVCGHRVCRLYLEVDTKGRSYTCNWKQKEQAIAANRQKRDRLYFEVDAKSNRLYGLAVVQDLYSPSERKKMFKKADS